MINHSRQVFHWTAISGDCIVWSVLCFGFSYKETKTSLVSLLTLLHECAKTLLILMTSEKYFYPLMTWLKLFLERLISIFNILRIQGVVVTQVLKTRHLMEVPVVQRSFLGVSNGSMQFKSAPKACLCSNCLQKKYIRCVLAVLVLAQLLQLLACWDFVVW